MKKRILSVLITLVMLISLVTVMSVSASAAGEHTHCICGETHASVGDHTTEQSVEWTAWNGTSAITYDENGTAYVYLSANAERSSTLTVESGNTLYLCLNGKKLSYAGSGKVSIFTVANGATLNITDCGSNTRSGHLDSTDKIWVESTADDGETALSLIGGIITGSTYDYGAVENGGTFNLYAGNIVANKRGVYNGGTFSMYGGNIAGNSDDGVWNTNSFNLYGSKITYNTGWGVNNDGTFTMNSGEISHNSHNAAENAIKTGVMNDGTFTMNSGKISDNSGDGVMNNSLDSKFIMNDGEISGNSGDGVYNPSTFTMYDGEISSNTGDGVYTTRVFTMNGGEISGNDRGVMYENGTASVSGAPVIQGNTNGNFCDYQDGYYLTISGALTDGAYIGVTLEEKFGEAAGPSMYDDTLPAAPDYIEYFYSDEGYGIYAEGDSIFVGNYITEQPNAENNYKVKTNDDANAIYQWYSVGTDEVTVTYDFLVEQDTGFDWMYNGNFDSQTNKWEPVEFSGGFGYLFVALDAGETFIAEFDSDIPTGYIALLGGWNNDNVIQATQQNGNIYTFKATEAGQYILAVVTEDEEPTALSEVVFPNVICKINAFVYTPLDGQTSATLDTTNLTTGTYVCKATWNMGTPDNSEDDYYCISAPVTLQYYDVTFDYGTLGSKTVSILEDKMITAETPEFAGHIFMGWFTDDTYQTPFNPTAPITESITVYAKFTAAVAKIEKTGTSGLVDTYTITYTDGTTTTFTVTNGEKGDKGDQGIQGIQGVKGADGHTPVITIQNGYWYIDGVNTNQAAQGPQGDKGDTGATGATGAQGPQGEKGDKGDTGAVGADGVGIANIEKTSSDGNVDTYTITLTNGTTYTFTVTNGTNGTDGKDGKDGTNGKDGVDGKDGTNGTNGVDGKDGANGTDGQTPYIGENGNWWIGDTDTGVKAAGDDGKDGAITVATAVGGTALISNIALVAWTLIKKKILF